MHNNKQSIMAHLVLGYPNLRESLDVAETYVASGVAILELQIPFSHPTADGPVITQACQEAVRQGVSVKDCLEAIAVLRKRHPHQEIMVMSYLNRIYAYGFQDFVAEMTALNVKHLIIPDLPADQAQHFIPSQASCKLVPVLAANTSPERVKELSKCGFDFYYLMSDFKITGSGFSLHPRLKSIVSLLRTNTPGCRIGIGFGISSAEQVGAVLDVADYAIMGSSLIKAQEEGQLHAYLNALIA